MPYPDHEHDHDAQELGWEEIDAEMASSAREASMGFGTLLEAGVLSDPATFAEAVRRRPGQGRRGHLRPLRGPESS